MKAERVRVSKYKQSEDGIKERWLKKRNKSSTDTHIQALGVSVSCLCFICCSFIVYFVISVDYYENNKFNDSAFVLKKQSFSDLICERKWQKLWITE